MVTLVLDPMLNRCVHEIVLLNMNSGAILHRATVIAGGRNLFPEGGDDVRQEFFERHGVHDLRRLCLPGLQQLKDHIVILGVVDDHPEKN